jgi:flagellar hook-associated protein 2
MTTTNIIKSMGASDIDTKELAANLVAATKEPRQKLIDAEKKKAEVAISSAALLKNVIDGLAAAAVDIASTSKINQVQISSSNSAVVSGTSSSTGTADAGTYSIEVLRLASPKRTVSQFAYAYKAPLGAVMTLEGIPSLAEAPTPATIDIGDKTPAQIASAINAWIRANAPNSKFSATIVDTQVVSAEIGGEPKPLSLILQGAPGTADNFTVGVGTDEDPNLHAAEFFPEGTVIDEPMKAQFKLNGVVIERAANKVTDVINGLTLELNSASNTPVIMTAKPDSSAVLQGVQNFVDTFNVVTEFIKKVTGPKIAGDNLAGTLQNDSTARGILQQLRSKITSKFSEEEKNISITHFSSLGIQFNRNGVLEFKYPEKFKAAYENNTADVITALSNDTVNLDPVTTRPSGLAGDVARLAKSLVKSERSGVPLMSKAFEGRLDRVDKKQAALDAYIERLKEQYDKQFTSLNAVLASFKNTASQLERSLKFDK